KFCTGSAVYQTATNEFAEYKFKAFYMRESSLIEELTEKTIAMIIGCFVFEDELNGVYNSMNRKTTDLSVICKYNLNPKGRHSNVAEATYRRTIFSVADELIFVEKFVFVLCETIEWNYYLRKNSKSQSCNETEHVKKKKKRDEELAKIEEVFKSKNQQQNKNRNHVIVED
ncbi:10575_t:CDS:2, partial [Dentiscutata heterogama]